MLYEASMILHVYKQYYYVYEHNFTMKKFNMVFRVATCAKRNVPYLKGNLQKLWKLQRSLDLSPIPFIS